MGCTNCSRLPRSSRDGNASKRSRDYRSARPANPRGIRCCCLSQSDPALAEHLILESLKLSFADAERYIGDPHFHEVEVEGLLSEPFIASRRELIQLDKALAAPTAGSLRGDTTYFTIVDKNRNAVSFITSLSDMFGSGMVAGDTGILLHNRAAEFSLEPGHPNEVSPRKRPRHSILPAVVFQRDNLRLTLGCPKVRCRFSLICSTAR